jgi:ribosomal protein S18 acetylase RimI-like enzyme
MPAILPVRSSAPVSSPILSTPGPTFRDAGPDDVPEVVALVEAAYRGEASRAGWTTEADLLDGQRTDAEAVQEILDDPASRLLLAVDAAGRTVACCHLQRRAGGVAYFGSFAVRPDLQGAGTGRALLAEAERRAAADWACATVEMTVIAQRTDLIAWYERRGYAATGETRPFPYGDERYGRPRRDDLIFVVLRKALPPSG